MVQVTQSEDEIKIIIELNRLVTRKPDIILMPTYLKFNTPPIFFERHLMHEIDEDASFCRIFKSEARIVLIKKEKGIWPEIFQKLSKEELFQRRLEISDQVVERNKERDQKALERYETKRRNEIDKEIKRETAMRERVKQFEQNAVNEALMVGVRKETHPKQQRPVIPASKTTTTAVPSTMPTQRVATPATSVRSAGKISVSFTQFNYATPKRESQEGRPRPFAVVEERENGGDQPQ